MLDSGITLKASNGIGEERSFRKMPRNRFQKGSIKHESRAGGPWFVLRYHQYIRQTDGSEKRQEKRVPLGPVARIGTKAAAARLAQPYLDRVNSTSFGFLKADILFPEFFAIYFDSAKLTLDKGTQLTFGSYAKTFNSFFERRKLSQMNGDDFQAFIKHLVTDDYAPTTIHNILQVLKQSWKWAVAKKYPVDRDAFLELKVPPKVKPEQRCFTTDECFSIIVSDDEPFKTMFWIAFEAGIRPNELLAFKKTSLEVMAIGEEVFSRLRIFETFSTRTGELRSKGKTKNALRGFLLSSELTAHLLAYMETVTNDLLFTNPDGSRITYHQLDGHLKSRCAKLGIANSQLKAFRHANASVMGSLNTPAAVVTERLGHFDYEFSKRNYMHALGSDELKLAKSLGLLSRPVN